MENNSNLLFATFDATRYGESLRRGEDEAGSEIKIVGLAAEVSIFFSRVSLSRAIGWTAAQRTRVSER